jgi:hypothetical protein
VLSFIAVRRSLGAVGLLLPVLLGPGGYLLLGIPIQENMSSYYHTPLRDVFVGGVCAIGVFLFCYRGHDVVEHWTGNVGCVAALGVALFPTDPASDPLHQSTLAGYLHTLAGGALFATLAAYSLFHFPHGHRLLGLRTRDEQRDAVYRTTGVAILSAVALMGAYLLLAPPRVRAFLDGWKFLFWMEGATLWAFAFAWLTKGRAILADATTPAAGG